MDLGRHLRELSRLQLVVAVSVLLAAVTALSVTYRVGLLPPRLEPRSVQLAAASTQVLVDTPRSAVLDLRQDTNDIQSMTNRAVLIGNVMASPPVLAYIGRRAHVAPGAIRAETPRTPNTPRPFAPIGNEPGTKDLLRSTNEHRISIEANPTVPMLRIYAQAPTAKAAAELANASVAGLRDYLTRAAAANGVAPDRRVRIEQLGRAAGVVINDGASLQLALVVFLVVFGASAAAGMFVARVRRGWREEQRRESERDRPAAADDRAVPAPPANDLAIR